MLFGQWSWFLAIALVAIIFYHDNRKIIFSIVISTVLATWGQYRQQYISACEDEIKAKLHHPSTFDKNSPQVKEVKDLLIKHGAK